MSNIIYSNDSGPTIWPDTDKHDPNSKKYYYIDYRPATRLNTTEYVKGVDVVIPSISNGCMYECVSGGISSTTPPSFGTEEGKTTIDGDVLWKCKPLTSRLAAGDVITLSTWSSTAGVTTSLPITINNISTGVRVDSVLATLKKFTLTNHITILRATGRQEEFEKSLIITVKEL
jgi:hypothetical protein